MNKLFTSIAVASLSLTMAVGVGVAVGQSAKDAQRVSAAEASSLTMTSNGTNTDGVLTAVPAKASGSSAPIYNASYGVRLYAKNTLTISSSSNITSMTIPWTKNSKKDFASVTADVGTYTHPSAAGDGTWTGSAKTIVLTVGTSGQIQLASIGYTVEAASGPSITTATTDLNVGKGEDVTFQITTANLETNFSVVSSDEDYVTASYTPSTTDGSHTITVHGEEITASAETLTISSGTASVTVNVNVVNNIVYRKVTSNSDIKAGRTILIGKSDGTAVMGTYTSGSNNIPALTSTPNASGNLESKDLPSGYTEFTIGGTSDAWTLGTGGNYLHDPNTSGKNYLYIDSTADTWSISVDSNGVATIANVASEKEVKNNGSIFACYSSAQTAVAIYMAPSSDPAIEVEITSGSSTILAGETATLTATLINGATGTINWAKSNNNVNISAATGATTVVTGISSGSADVTASVTNGSTVDPFVVSFTIKGGTVTCPYTVAEARAAIDANEGITDVYTTGIVSQVDSFNSDYGSITYWISDDGTTTNQLEVYSGLDLNQQQFSDISGVMMGDTVTVRGNLKKYSSTYEYDKNNYLTSHTQAAVTVTSIDSITGTLDAVLGADSWDLSGLVINGKLNGGSTQDITNYVTKTTSTPVPSTTGSTTVQVVVTAKSGYGSATATIGVSATVREISGPIPNGRYYIAHTLSTGEDLGLPAAEYTSSAGPESVDLSVANTLGCFTFELVDDNTYVVSLGDSAHYLNSIDNNKGIRVNSTKHNWNVEFVSSAGDYDYFTMKDTTYNRYLTSYVASGTSDFRSYAYNENYFKADRASGGQHGRLMIIPEKSYAEGVADKILESCVNRGSSSYDATAWGNASSAYAAITIEAEKNFLINGSAVKDSTVKLERALEQYDYAVSRYEGIDAFITGRTGIYGLANNASLFAGISTEATTAIIVVVALTSVTAIGAIFFIKRRKYN